MRELHIGIVILQRNIIFLMVSVLELGPNELFNK